MDGGDCITLTHVCGNGRVGRKRKKANQRGRKKSKIGEGRKRRGRGGGSKMRPIRGSFNPSGDGMDGIMKRGEQEEE